MINSFVTVITVTYNNRNGLQKTLDSLVQCSCKPYEIIVVDGNSNDGSLELIFQYKNILNIEFISEPDTGIYNAMNKGLRRAKTALVHYLNAGDVAVGNLYLGCDRAGILPVKIFDPLNGNMWLDYIKLSGYGYCHQGILFPSKHAPFNEAFRIAADFESVCTTFQDGLRLLPVFDNGHVIYELGGVSSKNFDLGNREILSVASRFLPFRTYIAIKSYIFLKGFFPRSLRRFIAHFQKKEFNQL